MSDYDPTLDPSDENPRKLEDLLGPSTAVPASGLRSSNDDPTIAYGGPDRQCGNEPFFVPQRIGPFRVLRMIGEGGMGAVYEAEQDKPRRSVALKVIRPGFVSKQMLRRFEHESEILGRLQHVGIAQIYQAGAEDSGHGAQPYFAMELIRGKPLMDHVRTCGLDINGRLELLIKVCDAVQYAHQQGVIHRDLKPGNLLVDEAGQPKILDFGVARATDSDVHATMATATGQIIGTLPYMSPEQAAGDVNEMDTRSDVYALGVIAYELLSGRLPYSLKDQGLIEAVRIIRQDEPSRLGTIVESLRGDVETIVGKALEKEKDRRYATASDLAADVRRYMNYEPISARAPSTLYQLRKFTARDKSLVTGIALLFIALAGGLAATTWQARRAMAQKEIAERRTADMQAMAERFMTQFHDAVAKMPGSTKARELLVTTSLEFLEKLRNDSSDSPALLEDVAAAYVKVGNIQGNPRNANLGRTDDALKSFATAIDLGKKLLPIVPNPLSVGDDLSRAYDATGDVLLGAGDWDGAMKNYCDSLAVVKALQSQFPNEPRILRNVWIAHERIGLVYEKQERTDDAMREYRTALGIAEQRATDLSSDREAQRDVSTLRERIAGILLLQNDLQAALSAYRTDRVPRRQRAEASPDDVELQRDLAITQSQIAHVLARTGDVPAATEAQLECVTIARKLVELDPANAQAIRDLSVHLSALGGLRMAQNDPKANDAYRESVELIARLHNMDPKGAQAQRDLSVAINMWARAMRQFGDVSKAIVQLKRSIALVEDLAKRFPDQLDTQFDLAITYGYLGDALAEADDLDGALAVYLSALDVTRAAQAKQPDDRRLTRALGLAYYQPGELLLTAARSPAFAARQTDLLRQAKNHFVRSVQVFRLLEARNTMLPGDEGVFDELNGKIKQCDDLLAAASTRPTTAPR